jgi:putative flippase GtrA
MRKLLKKRLIQFGEYFVGGNVFFVSGYLTFALCYSVFGWRWWQAKLLADTVGWTLNYLVQRYWAFQNRGLYGHEGTNRSRYIILSLVDTVLDFVIVGGLNHFGISPYIGMFLAAGFFTAWNYVWYRFWVFKVGYNSAKKA